MYIHTCHYITLSYIMLHYITLINVQTLHTVHYMPTSMRIRTYSHTYIHSYHYITFIHAFLPSRLVRRSTTGDIIRIAPSELSTNLYIRI